MMEFQEFLLVLEKKHKFYFFFDFFNAFLCFFDGFQGFWQGSSLQVVQNAAKSMVSLVFQGFTKQNDGIPGVFASFGRFWQETRWKSLKKT